MPIDEAISMEPIQKKLKNLKEYFPNQEKITYDFATFLASRLNHKLVPEGFATALELALCDAQQGKDGITGQPIEGRLEGYPSQMYDILRLSILKISETVFSKEFTDAVKDTYKRALAVHKEEFD